MAKSKRKTLKKEYIQIDNKEQADHQLYQAAKIEAEIEMITAKYNKDEQVLRNEYTAQVNALKEKLGIIDESIIHYIEMNKENLFSDKKRSVELQHGILDIRLDNPSIVQVGKKVAESVKLIEASDYKDKFLKVSTTLAKSNILSAVSNQEISVGQLLDFGLRVKQDEECGYKIKQAMSEAA